MAAGGVRRRLPLHFVVAVGPALAEALPAGAARMRGEANLAASCAAAALRNRRQRGDRLLLLVRSGRDLAVGRGLLVIVLDLR